MRVKLRNPYEWHEWFAWYPVRTDDGMLVWWETVKRRWNPRMNLRIIDRYDAGEYAGGWEYACA